MSKCDIRREFESQNRISYVKIGLRMSKCDIQPAFECQNRISNVRTRSFYQCQTAIFGPNLNFRIGFQMCILLISLIHLNIFLVFACSKLC